MAGNIAQDLFGVRNYWYNAATQGWYDMSTYIGNTWYAAGPTSGVFGAPVSLLAFYGKSPIDEWYVAPGK